MACPGTDAESDPAGPDLLQPCELSGSGMTVDPVDSDAGSRTTAIRFTVLTELTF
jgi:hypothetical protein